MNSFKTLILVDLVLLIIAMIAGLLIISSIITDSVEPQTYNLGQQ